LTIQPSLTEADLFYLRKELASRSLAEFARQSWHVLEPATALKWGWALDAICEHLEAVTNNQISRLLMNVPPGCMKSLLVGVIWPAWEWGPRGLQHKRFLGTAHKQDLAVRDAIRCRRLIQSDWFQKRWPVRLVADQNLKTKFENTKTGFREAMAFSSMTGSRGDRVLLDDPISVDAANSDVELHNAALTFTESLPTRVNNEYSAIVVIMQRLHQYDTSGVIIDNDLGYVHLMLPMRFEADRRCQTVIGFKDPREEDGDLLFPDRFDEKQVAGLEKSLSAIGGSYAIAGQLQQRPAPRGGGLFKEEWFKKRVDEAPEGCRWIRAWDFAATEDAKAKASTAYTAGVLMGLCPDGVYYVKDVVRKRGTPAQVEALIKAVAKKDTVNVRGSIPQDPGQSGKSQVHSYVKMLAGYDYHSTPETGSKYTRALPLAAQAEIGNVVLVNGDWNKDFVSELASFPTGKIKDQVDAASRAFSELVAPVPRAAMLTSKRRK
jgi:predicted phage terminase large subunit-like protein